MGTEVMALREALVREATARVKAEAESATLRAARDRAEAVCKALCGPSGFARSAAIWLRGNDMPSAAAALEAWAAGKGEPKPAPEPAKPTCGKCGRSDEAVAYVGERPTLCRPCYAEASRLAKLRARLAKLKPGDPIRWEADGNCALFRRLDGDEATVTPFGWTHDVKWEITGITILVPEGESHE